MTILLVLASWVGVSVVCAPMVGLLLRRGGSTQEVAASAATAAVARDSSVSAPAATPGHAHLNLA